MEAASTRRRVHVVPPVGNMHVAGYGGAVQRAEAVDQRLWVSGTTWGLSICYLEFFVCELEVSHAGMEPITIRRRGICNDERGGRMVQPHRPARIYIYILIARWGRLRDVWGVWLGWLMWNAWSILAIYYGNPPCVYACTRPRCRKAIGLHLADAHGIFARRLRCATVRMKRESCFVCPRANEPVDLGIERVVEEQPQKLGCRCPVGQTHGICAGIRRASWRGPTGDPPPGDRMFAHRALDAGLLGRGHLAG